GEALAQAVAARPFLIKPNRFELEQLVGRPLPTRDEVIREARVLHAQGVEWVCVSLGGEGAVLVGAETYIGHAPEVAVVSTVGAGDSMVGGLVAALSRHATPADALRLALACGSGTSQQPGTELFDPAALPGLQAQVNIQLIA
ncbi:MAG: 1-phosphofructokinase family hexose kinase, partial [Thiomonas sp.]